MQARKRRGSVSIGVAASDEEVAQALRDSTTCHVHGSMTEGRGRPSIFLCGFVPPLGDRSLCF